MLDPHWFSISNLPIEQMMLADLVWVPRILAGEVLKGEFNCGTEHELVGKALLETSIF